MERNIYKNLIEWKEREGHMPLVLLGPRQVGKTWILKEFGKREYSKVAYINCEKDKTLKKTFNNYETEKLIKIFAAISNVEILPKKTLIILDEIQAIPDALISLKYFFEFSPEYDIVVTGNMQGIKTCFGKGITVDNVEMLTLCPMTFSEFLMACNEDKILSYVEDGSLQDLKFFKHQLTELLRQYYFIGGMPRAVKKFVKTRDFKQVRRIQKQLLKGFKNDFSIQSSKKLSSKIQLVWDAIPSQLAKDNKKFIYGNIKSGARARDFEEAIQWLVDAGLVLKIPRVSEVKMPLNFYMDYNSFRLYLLDVGLFCALNNIPEEQAIIGDRLFNDYRDALNEQYVAQILVAAGVKPHYYMNEKSTLDMDFVVQLGQAYPVEVKAEKNLRAKSLKSVVSKGEDLIGWRFSMQDYEEQDWVINVPLYAVEEWIKYKGEFYEQ